MLSAHHTVDMGEANPENALLDLGGVPKRSTGADCKSAGFAFVGSNPAPSTICNKMGHLFKIKDCFQNLMNGKGW
jgi:hypothetical protein